MGRTRPEVGDFVTKIVAPIASLGAPRSMPPEVECALGLGQSSGILSGLVEVARNRYQRVSASY
jgi:hypothetical protein